MNYIYVGIISICILIVSSLLAKRSKKGRKVFIILSSVYSIVYLFWRAFFTLPTDSMINFIFAFLLFMAEAIGHIQSLIFKVLFWEDYKEPQASLDSFLELPTVDILIATYNEPEELLKLTAIGCINIDYPKEKVNIFLCDDGRRQKVKELADQLGIGYITRTDNKHAKAGNINNALTKTKGEVILLLDADMVPHPRILKRILPQFTDPEVGKFFITPILSNIICIWKTTSPMSRISLCAKFKLAKPDITLLCMWVQMPYLEGLLFLKLVEFPMEVLLKIC